MATASQPPASGTFRARRNMPSDIRHAMYAQAARRLRIAGMLIIDRAPSFSRKSRSPGQVRDTGERFRITNRAPPASILLVRPAPEYR